MLKLHLILVAIFSILFIRNGRSEEVSVSVALIGDSLISRAYRDFALAGKIQDLLPEVKLIFFNYAYNGARISDIRTNQLELALDAKPDIVILFWDSDCSDVDERTMNTSDVIRTRAQYSEALISVIKSVLATNIYLSVSGPEILGEGPIKPLRFWGKNSMLDDYRIINKGICDTHKVPYMDIRQAFLDAIPSFWLFNSKYLTVDGEHENERGTQIVANYFADTISSYLKMEGEKNAIYMN